MKKKVHLYHLVIIVIFSFAAFINVLSMDFVWDDLTQIKNNSNINNIKVVKEAFLTDTGTATSNGEDFTPYYRPLFTISLMIDGIIWGKNPFGYHLTNILLHLEITFLLYLLLIYLTSNTKISMAATALFAIHPVHSEAVAYISARTHLLCALFFMLSFLLYVLAKQKNRISIYFASMFFFICSMLSNEMGVTLPAVIIAHEVCLEEKERKRAFYPFIYLIVAALYVLVRFFILQSHSWAELPLEYRTLTGINVIEKYIKLLILPIGLNVFYDIPLEKDILSFNAIIQILLLIFHIAVGAFFWKKSKELFFGLAWIFLTLLPVSNIPAVLYPSLLSERYLYLPSIGFSMIFGFSFFYVGNYLRTRMKSNDFMLLKKFSYFAGSAALVLFILLTILRNEPYKNEEKLWETAVQEAPQSVYSRYRLALAYDEAGKTEKAKDEYEKVFNMNPQKIIRDRLIFIYRKLGISEAEALYKIGLGYLNKGFYNSATVFLMKSVKNDNKLAEAHNALGVAYEEKGLKERAIEEFTMAVKLNPTHFGYRENLEKARATLYN